MGGLTPLTEPSPRLVFPPQGFHGQLHPFGCHGSHDPLGIQERPLAPLAPRGQTQEGDPSVGVSGAFPLGSSPPPGWPPPSLGSTSWSLVTEFYRFFGLSWEVF